MAPTIVSETIAEGCLQKQSAQTGDWGSTVGPGKLPEHVQEVALKELREDENTRKQCLSAFRQWISKNPDIQNVNTGKTTNN